MKYYQPLGIADANASYIDGNPQQGIKGSVIPAGAIEFPQREIINIITKGGIVPDMNDIYQLTKGVRRALYAWGIDTGSTNSLSVALDPPLMSYGQGLEVRVLVAHDNNAACTIRINGLPTQQIVKKDGTTLIAGDMKAGGVAVLVHDGSNFQLVSGAGGSATITGGWFNGADYFVDTGTVNHIVGTPAIAPTAYNAGQSFLVLVKNANTGPVDVNVNALGVKPLKLPRGPGTPAALNLEAGDIIPNMLIRISYDGASFIMLSPIDMAIIETPVTKIVGPNTGADFADLNVAMAWATRRRIDVGGGLTLSLQGKTGGALVHNYSQSINIFHCDGPRLFIQGAGMNSIPNEGSFPITGYGTQVADSAVIIGYMRAAFQTEIRFTANRGLSLSGITNISNLLVTGPSMSATGGSGGITVNGYCSMNCVCSAYSPATNWYVSPNATLTGQNFYSIGAGLFGVGLAHSSNLLIGGADSSCIVVCCLSDCIQAAHGAIIQINGRQTGARFMGANGWGIDHWGASSVHCQYAFFYYNAGGGITTSAANAWIPFGNASNCVQGYQVTMGGSMDCSSCVTANVSSGDYTASNGGFMYAAAFQNPSAQFTPALNTIGNSDAYIVG